VGLDNDRIRLPKFEIASHRRALGEALEKGYAEKAAGREVESALPSARRRRALRIAIPAAAIIVAGLVVVLVFSLAGTQPGGEEGITTMSESQALAARVETHTTGFDFALFREVMVEGGGENTVLSPLSARLALAMAYNGANDEVAEEMAYVLDFAGLSLDEVNTMMRNLLTSLLGADENVQLEIANSIWSDDEVTFDPDFRRRCVESYDAEVADVDFQGGEAAGTIDSWVNEKTHGSIPGIAGAFDLEVLEAMLINALYFKGTWTVQFDPAMTADMVFHLADSGTKTVPMMSQAGFYDYYENLDFQAVSLPYGNGRLSMYIFLPQEDKNLEGFIYSLNRENWEKWMAAFDKREGMIYLPRFKMEHEKDLSPALTSLGMGSAFSANGYAFPKMVSEGSLWIDKVVQKTYMSVKEEGTEVAASTGIGMTWKSSLASNQPFIMEVNRPFFFAIADNQTGTLLFMGSIFEPQE